MPVIQSITYKPRTEKEDHNAIGYLRRPIQEANLVENFGIEGDRKGGNPKRNLNVMDDLTLAELATDGYPTGPGKLGENLILSGIDLRSLPEGTHLRLGDEAVISVDKMREPCQQLTPLDGRMPDEVFGRVGAMCRVVTSGRIRVGDPIVVLGEPVNDEVKICPDEP